MKGPVTTRRCSRLKCSFTMKLNLLSELKSGLGRLSPIQPCFASGVRFRAVFGSNRPNGLWTLRMLQPTMELESQAFGVAGGLAERGD